MYSWSISEPLQNRFFDEVGHETTYAFSGNIGFPNGPSFRYGNFFIPRVEKTSKNEPTGKKLWLPRAVGPREAMLFSHGLILRFFSTRGMKKFPYLKPTAHSEIVFLFVSIYAHPAKKS